MAKKNKNQPTEVEPAQQTPVEVAPVAEAPAAQPTETVAAPVAKKAAPKLLLPCLLAGIVLILAVAGIVTKTVLGSSKHAFAQALNDAYKEVSDALQTADEKFDFEKNAVVFGGTLKVDTNIKELRDEIGIDLKDLELSGSAGVDVDKKEILVEAGVKGKKEKLALKVFLQDNVAFIKTSFYDKVIKVEGEDLDLDADFEEITKTLDEFEIDPALYDNILEAVVKALEKSLDKDSMSKEKTTIDVLDKEIKVTKHTYKLNEKSIQKLIRGFADNLLEDKDFVSNVAKASNIDKSEIKDALKKMKDGARDITFDTTINFSVYTKGLLSDICGYELKVEKEKVFYYYENGDNVEAELNAGKKIKLTIEDGKKEREGKLTYDGETIASATIRSLEEGNIDFDFTIHLSELDSIGLNSDMGDISGTIYLTKKENKKDITGDYKFRIEIDDEYAQVEGSYSIENKDKLDGVDTSKAITEDELDEEEFEKAFEDAINGDEVFKEIFGTLMEEQEKKEEESKLNYNDMVTSDSETILKKLKSEKATVIYVGNTYYSSYYEEDASKMLNNLMDAQDDLEFHSYTVTPSNVSTELKTALAGIEFTCPTKTIEVTPIEPQEGENTEKTPTDDIAPAPISPASDCAEYPAIILVKGGKVVKAFRGTVDLTTLETELKNIGL